MAQATVVVLMLVDHRRASTPRVRREVRGLHVLNGVLDVTLAVSGGGAKVRVTDDLGEGLQRLPPEDAVGARVHDGAEARILDASPNDGVLVDTPPSGAVLAGYRLRLRRRGNLDIGAVHVRSLGPMGLAWHPRVIELHDRVRVLPGVEELRRERLPGLRPSLAAVGLRRTRRWGEGLEFESLREYQRGDDPRTVDWKASARRTQLVVRNYQVERNQTVVLAIDAGRLMREWIGDRERLDYALTAAFLVAERARLYGDRVGVIVFDDRVRTVLPAGRVRLSLLADTFATIESRLVEPNYPIAMATLKRAFRKRALVLLMSDVIDASASRAMIQGLIGTVSRHLPVAVALRNPDVDAVAAGVKDPASSPYRRGAAEAVLEARAKALQKMRRAGVHTVDVLPGGAAVAALDKYTEIKRRGLL